MNLIDKQIGIRLRIARKAAGFSTAIDFANKIGMPKSTYSQHENGQRSLIAEQIFNYANCLEVEPSWLLTGLGHPCPTSRDKVRKKAYIENCVTEFQKEDKLPILKNLNILVNDNSAVVNMDLFSKILVSAIKALINKDLQIPAEELVHFCVDVYNNVEFITVDGIEKNKIIELSINSIIRGNKITLKKASTQRK